MNIGVLSVRPDETVMCVVCLSGLMNIGVLSKCKTLRILTCRLSDLIDTDELFDRLDEY